MSIFAPQQRSSCHQPATPLFPPAGFSYKTYYYLLL